MSIQTEIRKLLLGCLALITLAASRPQASGPTAEPPADWHKISGAGVEFWLPESYQGGGQLDIDALADGLEALGPEYAAAAQAIRQGRDSILLVAYDTPTRSVGVLTNLVVTRENVRPDMQLAYYLNTLAQKLPATHQLIQTDELADTPYPTGRLVAEADTPQTGVIRQVIYAVKNGAAVWLFTFSTMSAEYPARAATFEQIVRSAMVPFVVDSTVGGNTGNGGLLTAMGLLLLLGAGGLRWWSGRQRAKLGGSASQGPPSHTP